MKLYLLASMLMTAQVRSSPRPQGWSEPPSGWSPSPVASEGIVATTGETLAAQAIALQNTMGDNIYLAVSDDDGDATMGVSTALGPDSDLIINMGTVVVQDVAESVEGPTVNLSSTGTDSATYNLSNVLNANVNSKPTAFSGGSLGTFAGSSWVQTTSGVNVAPGVNWGYGASGWKKDEGVIQN